MTQWFDEEKELDKELAMPDDFRTALETFPDQFPEREYMIEIDCPEFTSVCPKYGPARFRHAFDYLYSRPEVRGIKEPEAVPAEFS